MNKFIQYLALASVAVFGLASCVEEAPAYEPAETVGSAEVFFSPSLPATYNLKGNDGTISVTVSRVKSSGSLTANLTSSAPAEFTVPSSVTFSDGSKTATLDITFNPENLEEDVNYPVTITITNETSPYGSAEYSFTASIPSAWEVFGIGDLNEVWWGETEPKKAILYQDLSETLRMCKIENCFGYEAFAAGEDYPVQDYIFYWNTETNQIYIPIHSMGYVPSNYGVPVYYGDESAFYNWYWADDYGLEEGTDEWFAFCDKFRANYPDDYYPYYDGNGGFYLADQYIVGMPGTAEYQGRYNSGSDWDFIICEGYERFTDYNDDAHFGSSKALYEGYAASMLFSNGSEPVEFEQSMRYDADYEFDPEEDEDEIYTTYYLADYFAEGHSLAFSALIPEQLTDGAEILGLDNEQPAGIQLMGYDLYVDIKGGSVSLDGEFPVFTITLNVYTKNAEGSVVHDFGKITEVYTAQDYGKDGYTIDDIYGGYKEDYLGTWVMYSYDYFDEAEYEYEVVISDDGTDEDGVEWVKITNLSGYDGWNGMVDELYATYSNYTLLVPGQDLETPVIYQGAPYTVSVYPADPDTMTPYGQANAILAGICDDGALAFVNRYNGVNLSAFYYKLGDLGGLTLFGNIYGFQTAGASSLAKEHNYFERFNNKQRFDGSAMKKAAKFSGARMVRKDAVRKENVTRSVNVANCVKSGRTEVLIDAPMK